MENHPIQLNENYILALDQGTTSSRAILFNQEGKPVSSSQKEFEQIFPSPGWVEHNPNEIWLSQLGVIQNLFHETGIQGHQILGIGITNQRETTLIWDRKTGIPIYNALVWQDRRTAAFCEHLKQEGLEPMIRAKTGLLLDAYFSASKIRWILDHVPGSQEKAQRGELCFGTVDTWIVWKLTQGKTHITDSTNASRTLLYNIHTLEWDQDLLKIFDIPPILLPEVKSSSEIYAYTDYSGIPKGIPISGIAGDQQAALFGQLCFDKGSVKNTYGTGCFMVMNTGNKPVVSKRNLITTIAWQIGGKVIYALEGSIFVAGAAIGWIRDGLEIIEESQESEKLATSVPDNGGVYFVPALTGLGAPHWDPHARGMIIGLSRGSTKAHIARAALESIAFQVYDIIKAMGMDMGKKVPYLKVDGGAVANNFLMQFQSDVLGIKVIRPKIQESTALGAAYLAGLAVGFWKDPESLNKLEVLDRVFSPGIHSGAVQNLLPFWKRAVLRAKNWIIQEEEN